LGKVKSMIPAIWQWLCAYVIVGVIGAFSYTVFAKNVWNDKIETIRHLVLGAAASFVIFLGVNSGYIPGIIAQSLGALFTVFFVGGWFAPITLNELASKFGNGKK
jgi:hypothetical protein